MAKASLLRQLLAVVKVLLVAGKRLAKETWVRLLRQVAELWKILRFPLNIAYTHRKSTTTINDISEQRLSAQPTTYDRDKKPTNSTTFHDTVSKEELPTPPQPTTTLITADKLIPLKDPKISCSLHPYPYLNHSTSRASLQEGLNAARSAHSRAVSSRAASRSSQNLSHSPIETGSMQELGSPREHDGYTFTINSPGTPENPHTPTGRRLQRRQFTGSLPIIPNRHSPGAGEGYDVGFEMELGVGISRRSSPGDSMLETANPAGIVPSIHSVIHEAELGHAMIFPIVPEHFQRYDRPKFVPEEETQMTLKALTIDFETDFDPPGWVSIIHPEGVRYFYNEQKKTVTDARLYDPAQYKQITDALTILEEHIASNQIRLPEDYTLALDLTMLSDEEGYCDYYFADHGRRIVFFLDSLEANTMPAWSHIKGVTSTAHIRHEMESQYWTHGTFFPSTVTVTAEHIAVLRDIVFHYIGDVTTSQYSTSPYGLEELNQMLSQINSLEKSVGYKSMGASSLYSRLMIVFARQRFLNWHGLPEARLYRDQSVHGRKRHRKTLLIKLLSPFLFSAPDVHLKKLEKMWVDGIMHGAHWVKAIEKLNEEWQEFILYATVLLNANVAFLAIQSVDIDKNPYRSPIQIACYLSIVSSIGSIILGLLLMRQNRTRESGTADDVQKFLKERSHPLLGLETLAILYSLPYALLLWGMVSFLAAFAFNCFFDSSTVTRLILGAAWFAFAVLVLWCIWMGWVKIERADIPLVHEESTSGTPSSDTTAVDAASVASGVARSQRSNLVLSMRSRPGSALSGAATRPGSRASGVGPGSRLSVNEAAGLGGASGRLGETVSLGGKVGAGGAAGSKASASASSGGMFQTIIGPIWKFFHVRRGSYDSQRTVVLNNV